MKEVNFVFVTSWASLNTNNASNFINCLNSFVEMFNEVNFLQDSIALHVTDLPTDVFDNDIKLILKNLYEDNNEVSTKGKRVIRFA